MPKINRSWFYWPWFSVNELWYDISIILWWCVAITVIFEFKKKLYLWLVHVVWSDIGYIESLYNVLNTDYFGYDVKDISMRWWLKWWYLLWKNYFSDIYKQEWNKYFKNIDYMNVTWEAVKLNVLLDSISSALFELIDAKTGESLDVKHVM